MLGRQGVPGRKPCGSRPVPGQEPARLAPASQPRSRRSAASANPPWPPSNAGDSCGSSAAAPPGSPPSPILSSPSNSPPDQDRKGSLSSTGVVSCESGASTQSREYIYVRVDRLDHIPHRKDSHVRHCGRRTEQPSRLPTHGLQRRSRPPTAGPVSTIRPCLDTRDSRSVSPRAYRMPPISQVAP